MLVLLSMLRFDPLFFSKGKGAFILCANSSKMLRYAPFVEIWTVGDRVDRRRMTNGSERVYNVRARGRFF